MRNLTLIFILSTASFAAKMNNDSELARVGFLEFKDQQKNKSYRWVAKSLPEAIQQSMVKKFEFVEQPRAMKVAANIESPGQVYTEEQALAIAIEAECELLIYGNYTVNESEKRLQIEAFIYHRQGEKVIGVVKESSAIDNRVFEQIDLIAGKIVDSIYRFTLESEESENENLRVMVLVPSWNSEEGRIKAMQEFGAMKRHLAEKYDARFLTIFEFFDLRKVTRPERERVMSFARQRDEESIVDWLTGKGIEDAFIVFVAQQNVEITPVVQGKSTEQVKYNTAVKSGERDKAWARVAEKSNILKEKEDLKVSLRKSTLQRGHTWQLLALPGYIRPLGFLGRTFYGAVGSGFQASLEIKPGVELGIFSGGYFFVPQLKYREKMFLSPWHLFLAMRFPLITDFSLVPYGGVGVDTGVFIGLSKTSFILVPAISAGFRIDYLVSSRFLLLAHNSMHVQYDKGFLFFYHAGVGAGYRF